VRRPVSPSAEAGGSRSRVLLLLGSALVVLGVSLMVVDRPHPSPSDAARDRAVRADSPRDASPRVGHVFVVNVENKGFATTWGHRSQAPYLATTLRSKGVLLSQYYGTAHHSLGNYLAQISGQGPSYDVQHDCSRFVPFTVTRATVAPGQVVGHGCVYPRSVKTLPLQLTRAGLGWRGYMEDMARPCQHSRLGAPERWTSATPSAQYASKHNPFVYFRSIISRPSYCRSHVRPLSALTGDLGRTRTTRTLSYITPDLCHDGHDARCADGGPGGLRAANAWFKTWIPRILGSAAFRRDGMLVITADESEGVTEDSRGCCREGPGPNAGQPGIDGPGGGRVGALVIAPGFVTPGTVTSTPYNHYGLLATIEDLFGLPRLGYARTVPRVFGGDVFNAS
jgi:phosphatidylinositol-3-phosphatase